MFFKEEISQALSTVRIDEPKTHILLKLAAKFADVSFYANKSTPIAAPISAVACEIGRGILASKMWFKVEDEKQMKKKYGQ